MSHKGGSAERKEKLKDLFGTCVCWYVYVSALVCACVCAAMCMCVHIYTKVRIRCLPLFPLSFSYLFLKERFSRQISISPLHYTESKTRPYQSLGRHRSMLGIQAQVLMLAQQVFYLLSHLPRPK